MAAFIETLHTDNLEVAKLVAAHNAAVAAASGLGQLAANPDAYTATYTKAFGAIFKALNAKIP